VTSIVLAGGRSLRFGRNKALAAFGNQSLIERVIGTLSRLGDDIVVVTAKPEQVPDLKVRKVLDSYPPLTGAKVGLYSGIKASKSFHSLVVACDMPFLNIDLLRYLIDISEGFDVVIPRIGDKVEPLHAVYSKNCLTVLESQLGEGRLKISDLFAEVKVKYVDREEIEKLDPKHLSFINVNSEADMRKAESIFEKAEHD
jgi:molybdopterin-guanine dinucleotide biosynthesis protein A